MESERKAVIKRNEQHGELLGDLYRAIDLTMRTAKDTTIKGQASGNDFQVSNKFTVIRNGLANFIAHPVDSISALSAKQQLEKTLQGEVNAMLADGITPIILQDEGLFKVLNLQKERIKDFVENNHSVLIFAASTLIGGNKQASTPAEASKKFPVDQLLNNPIALNALIDILATLEEPLQTLCKRAEFKEKILQPLKLQDANIAPIISDAIKIAQQMPQHREILGRLLRQLPKIDFNKPENIADVLTLLQNKDLLAQITNLITIDNLSALWPLMEKQVGNKDYIPVIANTSPALLKIVQEIPQYREILLRLLAQLPKIDFNQLQNIEDILTIVQNKEIMAQISNIITIDNLTAIWPVIETQVDNQAYLPIIAAAGQSLTTTMPEIAKELVASKEVVAKVMHKIANPPAKDGVIDNDLRGDDLQKLAKIAISTLKKINASDLVVQHAPIFHGIIKQQYPNLPLPEAIAPIITESLTAFLRPNNLQQMEANVLPHLASIVDNEGAKQMEAAFKVGDAMLAMLKAEPWPSIYKTQLQPLVLTHKNKLGEFVDNLIKTNPSMSKFSKIKGEAIVALLAEPNTLTQLAEIYENLKKQSTMGHIKAGFAGVKAVIKSDNVRSIALTALGVIILEGLRDIFIPSFIRRALIGDRMHQQMHECLQNEKPIDMNAAFSAQENKPHDAILTYSLHNRACYDLDFKGLDFTKCKFNHFDFHNARFGTKEEGVHFHQATFRNTNFAGVELRGKNIDFTNVEFDLKSFKSLLPTLDMLAKKEGIEIKIGGMLVHGLNIEEMHKLKNEKSPFWEKYQETYLQNKPFIKKQLAESAANQSLAL